MKKAIIFILALMAHVACAQPEAAPTNDPKTYVLNAKADLSKPRLSGLKTLGTGISVGAAAGLFCYAIEKMGCNWFLSWMLGSVGRKTLLNAIAQDLQQRGTSVDEAMLHDSAWVSDWVAYIITKFAKNKPYVPNFDGQQPLRVVEYTFAPSSDLP